MKMGLFFTFISFVIGFMTTYYISMYSSHCYIDIKIKSMDNYTSNTYLQDLVNVFEYIRFYPPSKAHEMIVFNFKLIEIVFDKASDLSSRYEQCNIQKPLDAIENFKIFQKLRGDLTPEEFIEKIQEVFEKHFQRDTYFYLALFDSDYTLDLKVSPEAETFEQVFLQVLQDIMAFSRVFKTCTGSMLSGDRDKRLVEIFRNDLLKINLRIFFLLYLISDFLSKALNGSVYIFLIQLMWNPMVMLTFNSFPILPITFAFYNEMFLYWMCKKCKKCMCKVHKRFWMLHFIKSYTIKPKPRLKKCYRRKRNKKLLK